MKSQKNKLAFNKAVVTELNSTQLHYIHGGGNTTTLTTNITTITNFSKNTLCTSDVK